jgi:hypothetical protein
VKKLILALSLLCYHSFTFSAQEALFPTSLLQDLERESRHPISRTETETHIIFSASLKENFHLIVRASLEKSTGTIMARSTRMDYGDDQWTSGYSHYQKRPRDSYFAMQALYNKQQQEKREQGGQENKEEENQ